MELVIKIILRYYGRIIDCHTNLSHLVLKWVLLILLIIAYGPDQSQRILNNSPRLRYYVLTILIIQSCMPRTSPSMNLWCVRYLLQNWGKYLGFLSQPQSYGPLIHSTGRYAVDSRGSPGAFDATVAYTIFSLWYDFKPCILPRDTK